MKRTLLIVAGIILGVYLLRRWMQRQEGADGETETVSTMSNDNPAATAGTTHFSLDEFACKDGTPVPQQYRGHVQELMERLEVIRAHFGGKAITINSGYRTLAHNTKVGGAKNSQHLYARAADFNVAGVSPAKVQAAILQLIANGQLPDGGLGKYASWTHYDTFYDPAEGGRRWTGS